MFPQSNRDAFQLGGLQQSLQLPRWVPDEPREEVQSVVSLKRHEEKKIETEENIYIILPDYFATRECRRFERQSRDSLALRCVAAVDGAVRGVSMGKKWEEESQRHTSSTECPVCVCIQTSIPTPMTQHTDIHTQ